MSEEKTDYKIEPQPMQVHMTQEWLIDLLDTTKAAALAEVVTPEHDKLFAALAKAQGEIKSAIADKENKHFNFKYADLDACWEACRGPLSENELAVVQLPTVGENSAVIMRTILGHSSGQSISSVYTMYPDKTTPQGIASCMTYLRRYLLCAMVGISQEDDDANAASKGPDEYDRVSKIQVDEILVLADKLFKKSADAVVDRMLAKVFQVSAVSDIPAELHQEALNLLTNQHTREKKAAKPKARAKPKTDEEKLAEAEAEASPDVGDGPDNEVPGT